MKRGPESLKTKKTLAALKKTKSKAWKRVAELLERPNRKRAEVGLTKVGKYAAEGEFVVVPGKVLEGSLGKKISLYAFSVSKKAREQALAAGVKIKSIDEGIKENPSGKKLKVIV